MIRDQPRTEDVSSALNCIDPDISYSDWLRVGMALHSWDDVDGFELWDAWSRKGSKYEFGDTENRWDNFTSGGGITIKTLFSMAMENGYDPSEINEENEIEMSNQYDPTDLPCIALRNRFISAEVCKIYDVHTSVSELDGKTLDKSYFPYKKNGVITGWHVRNHNPQNKKDRIKPDIGVGSGKLDFFGQDTAKRNNGKKLFITEGRVDCLSLYETIVECTQEKWKHLKPSVVSVNNGAGSALKDCLNNRDFINRFDEVVLVFDPDEEGEKAVKNVLKSFPKFKVAVLPSGFDVNDMRKEERDKELFDIVMWKSENVRQGQVVDIKDFIETALIRPKMGLPWPWDTITKLTYGIRPHTGYVIGAAPKIGKSDHEYQVLHHLHYKLGVKVGSFDLENPPPKTSKKIASKEAGIDFTKPDAQYNDEDLTRLLMSMHGKIRFYDRGASRDWPDIRVAMEEMHLLDGINIFILDPLTALVSRFPSSEANDRLNEILTDMADFLYKYPVSLLMYSHVNPKAKGSKPHEDGGRVLSSEFTGSRAMEKWMHYGFGIRRNRSPDCPPEGQNISYLDLLFDRDFGNSGTATLFFDKDNMSYLEV